MSDGYDGYSEYEYDECSSLFTIFEEDDVPDNNVEDEIDANWRNKYDSEYNY